MADQLEFLSTYQNKVTKLGPSGDPIISGGNITMIGQPVGMFYGWLTNGIFMTKADLDKGPLWNPGGRDASRVGDVRFVDVRGQMENQMASLTALTEPLWDRLIRIFITG